MDVQDLKKLTYEQLYKLAQTNRLKYRKKMNKATLIEELSKKLHPDVEKKRNGKIVHLQNMSKKELRDLAKEKCGGYHGARTNEQLINVINKTLKGQSAEVNKVNLVKDCKYFGCDRANINRSKGDLVEMLKGKVKQDLQNEATLLKNAGEDVIRRLIEIYGITITGLEPLEHLWMTVRNHLQNSGTRDLLCNHSRENIFGGEGLKINIPVDYTLGSYDRDLDDIFINSNVRNALEEYFQQHGQFTALMTLSLNYFKVTGDIQEIIPMYYHYRSFDTNQSVRDRVDIGRLIENAKLFFSHKIGETEMKHSGLIYNNICCLEIKLQKFRPSTGAGVIGIPKQLSSTKGYVNRKHEEGKCFQYHFTYATNPEIQYVTACKEALSQWNWEGLEGPVELDRKVFESFEKKNPGAPPLNVHVLQEWYDKLPVPFYSSIKPQSLDNVVDILFVEKDNIGHYCWMKNRSKALKKLVKSNEPAYFCAKCYTPCYSVEKWQQHDESCSRQKIPQSKKMPVLKCCSEHKEFSFECEKCMDSVMMKFKRYKTRQELPVLIMVDTEARNETVEQASVTGKTKKLTKQLLCGYSLYFVIHEKYKSVFPKLYKQPPIVFKNDDPRVVRDNLIQLLKNTSDYVHDIINHTYVSYNKTEANKLQMINCHICGDPLEGKVHHYKTKETPSSATVVDHDHLLGDIRGLAHKVCNFDYTLKRHSIPVILHNFKGYDSKHIIQGLASLDNADIEPLVENQNRMKSCKVTVDKNSFQFIDSFQHMSTSLEKLVKMLASDQESLDDLRRSFPNTSHRFSNDNQFRLVVRKGVFPYDWLDSFDKLQHSELLSKDDFYSTLHDEAISDDDYEHYKRVWHTFNMKTFEDYYDLYAETDVLLLADVCQTYQRTCKNMYDLDPWWYITAPSLAWQAALKYTKQKLELITQKEMYDFFKNGIRGGVSYVAKKHARANNKYLENYDTSKESSFIEYIDCNNLYGWAMLKYLPVGNFRWIEDEEEKLSKLGSYVASEDPLTAEKGYVFECDLEYVRQLHPHHRDFPLMPEQFLPPDGKYTKLIPHMNDRKKYIVDGCALRMYLHEGVKMTKLYRCLEYTQQPWLQPYIELNSEARKRAKSDFEKEFYKLMNNAVYGQTLMDVSKFVDFKIYTDKTKYLKKYRKPWKIKNVPWWFSCENCSQLNHFSTKCSALESCMVGMECVRQNVMLNRPIYVGFKILELAKLLMYEFWYKLKIKFGERIKLLATDTDSFIFEIYCDDVYRELYEEMKDEFDLSNLDQSHYLYDDVNMKVPGKFKNEVPKTMIISFYGLASKCYSYECKDQKQSAVKAKGVVNARQKHMTHEDYARVLQTGEDHIEIQKRLQGQHGEGGVNLIEQKKVAISQGDDKRVNIEGTFDVKSPNFGITVPHGYNPLPEISVN